MLRRLRDKLLLVFLLATVLPTGLSLFVAARLLEESLALSPIRELEESTQQLEASRKALYSTARQLLRERVGQSALKPQPLPSIALDPGESERFFLDGTDLVLLRPEGAYRLPIEGARLESIPPTLERSREAIEAYRGRDLRRGFIFTLAIVTGLIWILALIALLFFVRRVTRPIQLLTRALREFAAGQRTQLPVTTRDEVGEAISSFNDMSTQLDRSREKLLYLTRLEGWQGLARKMAHEVKNSLTPIRLTVEEMVARSHPDERPFLEQASQIVVDEVQTLERRVRAFSELASEPPLHIDTIDLNALVEERIAFLRAAHPGIIYRAKLHPHLPLAQADADLVKGIFTNLLENAADAVGSGGVIAVITHIGTSQLELTIEDSGPGLSLLARESLFQPTISFKRTGMGLGLSIAKRSALLMGGDLELVTSSMGGAAFRLRLDPAPATAPSTQESPQWPKESSSSMTKTTSAVPSA